MARSKIAGSRCVLKVSGYDCQNKFTAVGDVELAVNALGIGLDGAEGQTHVRCDRAHLLARQSVLDEFQFPRGKPQVFTHAAPLYGIEKGASVFARPGRGRPE